MAVKNNREGAKPAKIKKRFVRYREGAELYSMSERSLWIWQKMHRQPIRSIRWF